MNGDQQKIDFTVADRVLAQENRLVLSEINQKFDKLIEMDAKRDDRINKNTIMGAKNTAWIKAFKWGVPIIIVLMITAKIFGY